MFLAFRYVLRPDASALARPDMVRFLDDERRSLGPLTRAEKWALSYAGFAILLWLVPDLANLVAPGPASRALAGRFNLAIPALLVPVAMCLTPIGGGERRTVLTWDTWARGVDWGMVLFIGGVLGLGTAVGAPETGISESLKALFEPILGGLSVFPFVFLLSLGVMVVTGLTSNLVCVSIFVPLGLTLSQGLGIGDPAAVGATLGIAASLAYMLPSGSTTNAIVAGSGWLRIEVMLRQGFVLVLLHALVLTGVTYPLARLVLGAR